MICWHVWEILKQDILKSPMEDIMDRIEGSTKAPSWMFRKKVIITKQCKKCNTQKVEII